MSVEDLLVAVDAANSLDPNVVGGEPLALVQGRAATRWLGELDDSPSPELQLAVRAHHLRRWEIIRTDFPEGRAGYLKWRRANKAHQAESLADLMDGWPDESVARVRTLMSRVDLTSDTETQTLEDAACLVFLETQFNEMAARTDTDRMISIVTKTLKKMSPTAVSLTDSIAFSPTATTVLASAVAGA